MDYSWCAFPKGSKTAKPLTEKARRAKKRRAMFVVAADDREVVFQRQQYTCFAVRVSPVCTRRVDDPHELIPVGRGGPRVSWNRVGTCRACHRAAQGAVGGNRLVYEWPGKADGAMPNADVPGNVTCRWRGKDERE